jgi:hypothetical protein
VLFEPLRKRTQFGQASSQCPIVDAVTSHHRARPLRRAPCRSADRSRSTSETRVDLNMVH